MVYSKTVTIAMALILVAGLGACGEAPKDRFEDDRTGKTYSDTTELLAERKTENPNEFRVVTELANEEPQALEAYVKAFENKENIAKPAPTLYFDESGEEVDKVNFLAKLKEKQAGDGFEEVVKNYFMFLSESKFEDAFSLINKKSPFTKIFFDDFKTYKTQQESSRNTIRYVESFITDCKLTPQSYPVFTIDVYFKTLSFFRKSQEIKNPEGGNDPGQDPKRMMEELKKSPEQMKNEIEKIGWDFRYSGVSKFTLAYIGGKWLIYE
jgi:hypothetical protein